MQGRADSSLDPHHGGSFIILGCPFFMHQFLLFLLYVNSTEASLVISSVSCSYPNKNITIKIDESSSNPHYLAFVIWFQQGRRDITTVQLCEVLSASLPVISCNFVE